MTLTITERVAAGAAWLDENEPGWVERIDLEALDIDSGCNCVLGQVYAHYFRSPVAARWTELNEADKRYEADGRGFNGDRDEEMDALTAEWKRLIEERRAVTP